MISISFKKEIKTTLFFDFYYVFKRVFMSTDEYGYPTFGKIYSFIRDVITDDALLEIAK